MVSQSNRIELTSDARESVRIVSRLQEAGFIAYLAGGCVRDALLNKTPKDYDVATNATPETVREVFGQSKTLAYGVSFGVIGVLPERRLRSRSLAHATEVATFRSDGHYSDGRRPDSVHFGDPQQDALRRDFTINGLFYDPIAEKVIDFVDGQKDLADGILRTIGDPNDRFGEDRLRMLRAIRFSATLGFAIDRSTESAITQHAPAMVVVSEERIGAEMRRVMVSPFVMDGLRSLVRTQLAANVLPPLLEIDFERLTTAVLASGDHDFRYRLGAILALANEPQQSLKALTARWRLSNEEVRSLSSSLRYAKELLQFQNLPWSQTQPVVTDRDVDFILGLAISLAALGTSSEKRESQESFRRVQEVLGWPEVQRNPPPLLTGDDLRNLGYIPGPAYARILKQIRVLQLDGRLSSRDEAIDHAIEALGIR